MTPILPEECLYNDENLIEADATIMASYFSKYVLVLLYVENKISVGKIIEKYDIQKEDIASAVELLSKVNFVALLNNIIRITEEGIAFVEGIKKQDTPSYKSVTHLLSEEDTYFIRNKYDSLSLQYTLLEQYTNLKGKHNLKKYFQGVQYKTNRRERIFGKETLQIKDYIFAQV